MSRGLPAPTPWLALGVIEAAEPAMAAVGAAEVARGVRPSTVTDGGFIGAYRYAEGDPQVLAELPATARQSWADRRRDFIARHMAQVEANSEELFRGGIPTPRLLGLIAWAYVPPEAEAELTRWISRGAPSSPTRRSRRNGEEDAGWEPDFSAEQEDKGRLKLRMLPPVPLELHRAFHDLIAPGGRGYVLGKSTAAAVPALARLGLLKITGTYGPGESVSEAPWTTYDVQVTRKGGKAYEDMAAARAEYQQKYQQLGLFGARSNPDSGASGWDDAERAGAEVQSVLFPRGEWSPSEAREWLRRHALRGGEPDVTRGHLRFRQRDPRDFRRGTFRSIPFGTSGISAVVAVPG
jgi:hypothetical protein